MKVVFENILEDMAKDIKSQVFDFLSEYSISLFLIGRGKSSGNEVSHREIIRKKLLEKNIPKWRFDIYYPENIFSELLGDKSKVDLLTLENLLVRSVNCVLIVVESPGSIAELGAFSNHDELRQKIVVVADSRFEREKSFINLGPLRLIKKENKNRVIYTSFESMQDLNIAQIRKEIVNTVKVNPAIREVNNFIYLRKFLLTCVFVAKRLNKRQLIHMIGSLGTSAFEMNYIVTSSLNLLLLEGDVELSSYGQYRLTRKGYRNYIFLVNNERDSGLIIDSLDRIRISYLNASKRNRQYRESDKWSKGGNF